MKRTPAGTPTGGQYAPDLRKTKPPIIINPKLPTGGAGTTQTKPATNPCAFCNKQPPAIVYFIAYDGWGCGDCMKTECDRCDNMITIDEDCYAPNGDKCHRECLSVSEEMELTKIEQNNAAYETRVTAFETMGMDRSDAQAAADAEDTLAAQAQLTAQAKANTMNTVTCKHCQKELVRAETVSARPMQGWATIEESQNRFLCNYGSFVTQHVPV